MNKKKKSLSEIHEAGCADPRGGHTGERKRRWPRRGLDEAVCVFVCLFAFHCDKMEFSAPQKRELGPEPPHFPLAKGEAAGCRYGSRHRVLAGGAGGRLTAE